jgi:hypothetical protein
MNVISEKIFKATSREMPVDIANLVQGYCFLEETEE